MCHFTVTHDLVNVHISFGHSHYALFEVRNPYVTNRQTGDIQIFEMHSAAVDGV